MSLRIYDQVSATLQEMVRLGIGPGLVTFNHEGHRNAMLADVRADHFCHARNARTYLGVDYAVNEHQNEEVSVWSKKTAERKLERGTRTFEVKIDAIRMHERLSVLIQPQTWTAAQVCDIIRAWLDSDDPTAWGDFEKALDRAVTDHGRFE